MANSWSITINQRDGKITFTPDIPRARIGQPLGVNSGDNVTWNNQTNQPIELRSMQPEGLFLCDPIPAGIASDPIFKVGGTVGYYWVRQSGATPAEPDAWVVVV